MMKDVFHLMLVQANPVAGDIAGNAAAIRSHWQQGRAAGVDLVALPQRFLTGWPVGDLILKPAFQQEVIAMIETLMRDCADGPALGFGAPALVGAELQDSWYVLQGGRIRARASLHGPEGRSADDEARAFAPSAIAGPYDVNGVRLGTILGSDVHGPDVAETLAETGAEILIAPVAAPYHDGKTEIWLNHHVSRVVETGLPLVSVNMVGGQEDLVFDGASSVFNPGGRLMLQMRRFEEQAETVTFHRDAGGWRADQGVIETMPDRDEADYHACVLGLRDYMRKSGFDKALIGLSGGFDSALVAAIAVDAIGADNLRCFMLPSGYTSAESRQDAVEVATALGCQLDSIPIGGPFAAITEGLAPVLAGAAPDVTEENIQARLRGLLLMALSNKLGGLLLTTGNKSEVAVGYCTLYGDMCGGFNPLKDMYKSHAYEVARWRNGAAAPWMKGPAGHVIPERVLTRPPSAELRPDQKDADSLPPYDVLDPILIGLIENDESIADLIGQGFAPATVTRVARLLQASEYKRRQAAPGVRLTRRAFGSDRRYPFSARWNDKSDESEG